MAQAEELNGFICEHLSCGDNVGSTIVFYSKKEDKNALLGLVPTESVQLVRVARYQPENILAALQTVETAEKTHLYVFPSGFAGSEIAVRWACRMKGSSLVQVKQIECSGAQLIARKTVYANHVLGTFKLTKRPYCISLAKGSADSQAITMRDKLIVTEHDLTGLQKDQFIKHSKWIPTETTIDLEAATFLIIGGRGMRTKENTQSLKKIADSTGRRFRRKSSGSHECLDTHAPDDRSFGRHDKAGSLHRSRCFRQSRLLCRYRKKQDHYRHQYRHSGADYQSLPMSPSSMIIKR